MLTPWRSPFRAGFTLIELLVVVAIVGLLATVAVLSISSANKKARDAKRRADLKTIQKALDLYFQENGAYPSTGGLYWGACAYGNKETSGPNGYIPNLAPAYIGKLPVDPKPGIHTDLTPACNDPTISCYLYISNGTTYKLMSHCALESGSPAANDPMIDPNRPAYSIMVCDPLGAGCTTM
jgi:type II secretion system protein G